MEKYKNFDGDSGIEEFEIENNSITIHFKKGKERFYKYSKDSVGIANFDKMVELARNGRGLNEFINKNPKVKTKYVRKW